MGERAVIAHMQARAFSYLAYVHEVLVPLLGFPKCRCKHAGNQGGQAKAVPAAAVCGVPTCLLLPAYLLTTACLPAMAAVCGVPTCLLLPAYLLTTACLPATAAALLLVLCPLVQLVPSRCWANRDAIAVCLCMQDHRSSGVV
jgi:hypothetical protein